MARATGWARITRFAPAGALAIGLASAAACGDDSGGAVQRVDEASDSAAGAATGMIEAKDGTARVQAEVAGEEPD